MFWSIIRLTDYRHGNRRGDIDLVVVSPDFDNKIECKTLDKLWKCAGWTDYRIEPIPCGLERWEKDNYTPIIDIARNEGTIVTLN